MPRLRVVAGPSLDALVPISVNSGVSHDIVSDAFEGQIATYIKDFTDEKGNILDSEYFRREDRKGITWSIQACHANERDCAYTGRFLRPISADDVLFGNTFDRPLKLPWGTSAALKFMHFIDPTLEHDLTSNTKPWALSPFISTMPHVAHRRMPCPSRSPSKAWPPFPSPQSLSEDTAQLHFALSPPPSHSPSPSPSPLVSRHPSSGTATPESEGSVPTSFTRHEQAVQELRTADRRRAYFRDGSHRRELTFGPKDIFTIDFCYGFIHFSPTLALHLPGGISFDLMHYWDGQPVRFVCCERKREGEEGDAGSDVPWGRILWCMAIE
ncbi:hypothetical protein BC826DRAFT_875918, partial [Russula brevipes]